MTPSLKPVTYLPNLLSLISRLANAVESPLLTWPVWHVFRIKFVRMAYDLFPKHWCHTTLMMFWIITA
jgi:hypothetical protein